MHGTYILNAFPPKDLPDEPSPAVDLRPAASYLSSYAPGPPYWGSLGARSELFIPLLTGPTATMSHLPRGSAPGTPPRVLAFIDHVSPSMSPPLRPLPSPLKVWDTSEAPLPFSPPAVAEGGKGWTRRASLVPQSGELSTHLPLGGAPGPPPLRSASPNFVSPSMSPLSSPPKVRDTSVPALPPPPLAAAAEGGKGWTRRATVVPQSGELSPSPGPSDAATGVGNRPSPTPRRVPVRLLVGRRGQQDTPRSRGRPSSSPAASSRRRAAVGSSTSPGGGGRAPGTYPDRMSTPDDAKWLSSYLCYIRSECIEVFEATDGDVADRTNSKKVRRGQVGIRCRYCAHLPIRERSGRSTAYPGNLMNLHQSLYMVAENHLSRRCPHLPPRVRARLLRKKARARSGASAPDSFLYWVHAARQIGLRNGPTPGDGIRFIPAAAEKGKEGEEAMEVSSPPVSLPREATGRRAPAGPKAKGPKGRWIRTARASEVVVDAALREWPASPPTGSSAAGGGGAERAEACALLLHLFHSREV